MFYLYEQEKVEPEAEVKRCSVGQWRNQWVSLICWGLLPGAQLQALSLQRLRYFLWSLSSARTPQFSLLQFKQPVELDLRA
ncbi:unnamed protein product [Knipowitschia caucasica]